MITASFAAPAHRMPLIELPRALEDYFAFAETEPTRKGRRFSITLTYYVGDKIDRLQWWYHVSPAQERMFGRESLAVFRERAVTRFCRHIEQWLANTRQRLHDGEPIPRIGQHAMPIKEPPAPEPALLIPEKVAVNA
jgi:hypothetical protein